MGGADGMADEPDTKTGTGRTSKPVQAAGRRLLSEGVRFDALFVTLSVVLMLGLAWDFRVHAGGVTFEEEGFWTVPHMIVYGGGAGIAALLGTTVLLGRRRGLSWGEAVPTGYGMGLVGLVLFGLAGAGDFVWHTVISHEDTTLEAMTSPPHLGLAVGGALFLSSPLRAAWRREGQPLGFRLVPALLSLSFVLSIAVVFAAYVNPLAATQILWEPRVGRLLGLAGMVVFPVVILAASLALVGRFELPMGALTVTFLVPGLVSVGTNERVELLIPLLIATLVADLLVRFLPPTADRPRSLRLFGFLVPVTFALVYFLVVEIWHGLAPVWTTHLWTGATMIAGLSGLLFTYALVPDGKQSGAGGSR